ncbi:MAG: FliA/WhiG family RNA polymerase sigma factor [Deltaproteobacteria bacterium]|nr:FliA/WhiG family RNA polymerase sigma factor [Deltaproteobacteria bacterium]TLN04812.1 MAG: FliA/WhiG family RNA polymerase sigma factor [bacterium]
MNTLAKVYETECQVSTPQNRDELVLSHLPLVKYLVGRISSKLPPHLDQQDLMSVAVIGLITAAERFDPRRGILFKTFAEKRVMGSIMDELRAQDWLPRTLREKYKRLEHEFSVLEQKLGRNPSSEEVASAMGMDLEKYFQLMEEVHSLSFMSLEDFHEDDEGSSFGFLNFLSDNGKENPQNQMMAKQLLQVLGNAIESLPDKERLVVTLYYYEELNLKEIGEIMGLTESRISQLHSQAVIRLKVKMKNMAG